MIAYRLDIKNGDILDNKYYVVERIGRGSYGDIFKVYNRSKMPFALKVLRLWEVSSELHAQLLAKFEQEYKAGKLSGDYLIHSLDYGYLKGNPYIVMEFCPDGDLSSLIGKDLSKLPVYAYNVLMGLHELHSEGKIHRDLKPENVLLRQNGKAALTDFGVVGEMDKSKRMSEVGWWRKRPKQMQGTPLYMAPEMVERAGGGVTYLPTVDIWSFGVMIYEILTNGSFPFGNIDRIDDLPEYQNRAKDGRWDKTKLMCSSYGHSWVKIIDKCLIPDYRERYQHVNDIIRDMKQIMGFEEDIGNKKSKLFQSTNVRRLVVTQGINIGATYDLEDNFRNGCRMIRIGRDTNNDIVLKEEGYTYVSRNHFTIERSSDLKYWIIRDGQWHKGLRHWVQSTNGTYINTTPLSSVGVKMFTGDIITAGEYKIKVE